MSLPVDILSHVADFTINSSYDVSRFAAVSWTWIRAIAASEKIITDVDANPDDEVPPFRGYWFEPLNGEPSRTYAAGLRLSRFLEVAIMKARLELVDDCLVALDDWCADTATKQLPALKQLFQPDQQTLSDASEPGMQSSPKTLHIYSMFLNNTDGSVLDNAAFRDLRRLSFRPFGPDDAVLERLLLRSASTLSRLSLNEQYAACSALRKLTSLTQFSITSFRPKRVPNEVNALYPTAEEVFDTINSMTQLTHLDLRLQAVQLSSALSCMWPSKLHGLSRLEKLKVASSVHKADLQFDGMSCGASLVKLDLTFCDVTKTTLKSVIDTFPNLRDFGLVYSNTRASLSPVEAMQNIEVLAAYQSNFSLSMLPRMSCTRTLKTLEIDGATGNCRSTCDDESALCSLRSFQALQALTMSKLNPDTAFATLIESLNQLPDLQYLSIHDTKLDGYDADFSGLVHLTVLDLRDCDLKSTSLVKLGVLRRLRYLDVCGSSVDDDAMAAISQLPELLELRFDGSATIGDVGARALGRMKRLDSLYAVEMKETFWATAKSSLRAAESDGEHLFAHLQSLDVSGNAELKFDALSSLLTHMRELRRIDLGGCPQIGAEDLEQVTTMCKRLVDVTLSSWQFESQLQVMPVAKVLVSRLSELQCLDMGNLICDAGDPSVVDELVELLNSGPQLRDVSVDDNLKEQLSGRLNSITVS